MRDSRTTQSDDTAAPGGSSPEPGLVIVFVQSAPSSIVVPLVAGEVVLGRALLAQHGVDDARMSRKHVRVSCSPSGWRFQDLGSRNGSFVDGVRVDDEHAVVAPRVLRAGDTLFLLVADMRAFIERAIEVEGGVVLGPTLRRVFDQIARAAASSNVLHIQGETGVGKELAARHFHARASRARGPFVPVNCAAIPAPVAERLLFGVRRGTYTGADADADGFIQVADGGTLFLDEIADLDLTVQAKLLRAIELGELLPLGAAKARKVDVAFLSATAVELEEYVANKTFRQDLYFRIARPTVRVPPLRDRLEEIPWLVGEVARTFARTPAQLHVSFVETALCRAWPGNVRELLAETRGALQTAIDEGAAIVRASHLAPRAGVLFERAARPTEADRARERERARLVDALRRERGNVAAAARRLEMHRTQLRRILVRLGIDAHAVGREGGRKTG
jgi:transcriptional regulator with GAF, ATPase, and Fis domain